MNCKRKKVKKTYKGVSKMRILIIGGTRFIGRHVVPELLYQGHQLILLNRGNHELPWVNADIEQAHCDRDDAVGFKAKMAQLRFDVVIDMILYNARQAEEAVVALQGMCQHYFMLSTRSVYAGNVTSPIRESDHLETNPEVAYGFNKAQAEQVLLRAHQQQGFPATILRLPAVYGEYDYQIRERYFIKRFLDKRTQMLLPDGGCGVNQREYAGNIAAQLAFLLQKPESIGQIYNTGHAKVQTYRALVEEAMSIMSHHATLYSVPTPLFPAVPDLAAPRVHMHSTGKLEALRWMERYSIREGLSRTITWLRQEPDEILPTHRNKSFHFDYALEDEVIASRGVLLG